MLNLFRPLVIGSCSHFSKVLKKMTATGKIIRKIRIAIAEP